MQWRLKSAVRAWLRREGAPGMDSRQTGGLETGAEEEAAERALRRVFRLVPGPAPPPDFAAAVLRRLGLAPAAPVPPPAWALRLAIGLGLVLAGSAAILLPGLLAPLAAAVSVGGLADFGAGLVVQLLRRLAAGLEVWWSLAGVGRVLSAALGSPAALAAVAASTACSAAAFRLLQGLMLSERSAHHVEAR